MAKNLSTKIMGNWARSPEKGCVKRAPLCQGGESLNVGISILKRCGCCLVRGVVKKCSEPMRKYGMSYRLGKLTTYPNEIVLYLKLWLAKTKQIDLPLH